MNDQINDTTGRDSDPDMPIQSQPGKREGTDNEPQHDAEEPKVEEKGPVGGRTDTPNTGQDANPRI